MDSRSFYGLVQARRMVRNYTDEAVDLAGVRRIVDAARRGPSAGYSQGVSFVVVTDPVVRARIAELGGQADYVARGFDPWISRAAVLIVVCVSEEAYRDRYREPDKSPDGVEHPWPIPYWWVDAGAALMTILLGAVAEGLAAGLLGAHATEGLASAVGLPPDVVPVGVVTLGHPAVDRRSSSLSRGRRPWDDVVHHDRWGRPLRPD